MTQSHAPLRPEDNDIAAAMRHRSYFARNIRNHRYEVAPNGILMPDGTFFGGAFDTEHRRFDSTPQRARQRRMARLPVVGGYLRNRRIRAGGGDLLERFLSPNVIPTQGLDQFLNCVLHGGTQISPWYVALFTGNVTPGATLTGQTFNSVCTEFTGYDEATRVVYNEGASSGGVIDNAANRAVFTCNATATVYGGALLSVSGKLANGASDLCLAAARFSASRNVVDDDELATKYTLTATSG